MNTPFRITLIDSYEQDVTWFTDVSCWGNIHHFTDVCPTTQDAFDYINFCTEKHVMTLPHLFVIDIEIENYKEVEFLRVLKGSCFRYSPCIVFSRISTPEIVQKAYENGVTSFIKKPSEEAQFRSHVKTLLDFWGCCSILPPIKAEIQMQNSLW